MPATEVDVEVDVDVEALRTLSLELFHLIAQPVYISVLNSMYHPASCPIHTFFHSHCFTHLFLCEFYLAAEPLLYAACRAQSLILSLSNTYFEAPM